MSFEAIDCEHSLYLSNRTILSVTGVKDVLSFDDESIKILTHMGSIALKGSGFKIDSFNTESGDMKIKGNFTAIVYFSENSSKDNFLRKLLR